MPKNITLEIIERLDKIEKEQKRLAEEKAIETGKSVAEVMKPAVTTRAVREKPVGICNGINNVFSLKNSPLSDTEEVYLSGILLSPGELADYTINGRVITLNYSPDFDDEVIVSYEFSM